MNKQVTTTDITGVQRDVFAHELSWRPAAYALIIKDDKILLTKQYDAYHLPGGGLDLGETPEEAVIREVFEETGVVVDKPKLVATRNAFFSYSGEHGHDVQHFQSLQFYYRCHFVSGELSMDNMMDDEKPYGDMPEWIDLDKLGDITAGGTVEWLSIVRDQR